MGVIRKLPGYIATSVFDIPAEFLQCFGPESLEIMTDTINSVYAIGEYLKDFFTTFYVPFPRTSNATQCEQYRTISLITHACKILLHMIKECQFGFRRGSGTREAIYVLRTMGERMIQLQKDLCIAFIDYTKLLIE